MNQTVHIIETGVANTASVAAGVRTVGLEPRLTADPRDIEQAERLILPGVGAYAAGMQRLSDAGLVEPLRERLAAGRPTMSICLGMQLLAKSSEESPGVAGLGILPVAVKRFDASVRTPQLGWNRVAPEPGAELLRPGYAYFANSYRLADAPPGWTAARTEHGGRFISALEKGALLACQFHPELSGRWGLDLIDRWAAKSREEAAAC